MKQKPDKYNSLHPDLVEEHLFGFGQQTGVNLITSEGPMDEKDFDTKDKALVPPEKMPIELHVSAKLNSLIGIAELIQTLREDIFVFQSIGDQIKINDLQSDSGETNKQTASADKETIFNIFKEKKSAINKYITVKTRIDLLITVIEEMDKTGIDRQTLKSFEEIKEQLKNWQRILDEILYYMDRDKNLETLLREEAKKQEQNGKELRRLKRLFSGERAIKNTNDKDEWEKNGWRAIALQDRIIQSLKEQVVPSEDNKEEIGEDLIEELWTTATTINEIRIIDRLREKDIDLIVIKKQVKEIKEEYRANPQKEAELNNQLIELIIPIANAIAEMFPHNHDSITSSMAAVLYQNEAICAGKTEVLNTIFKLIGLNTKAAHTIVEHSKLNKKDIEFHSFSFISILGNQKLIVDANSPFIKKEIELAKSIDPEYLSLFPEIKNELKNSEKVPKGADVLIYIAKPTKDILDLEELFKHSYLFVSQDEDFKNTYYTSSVPHPHKSIYFTNKHKVTSYSSKNNLDILAERNIDKNIDRLLKIIENSPNDIHAIRRLILLIGIKIATIKKSNQETINLFQILLSTLEKLQKAPKIPEKIFKDLGVVLKIAREVTRI